MDVEEHVDPWEQQDHEVDPDEIVQRVAALDIGKGEVVCCVRLPGQSGRRRQLVRTFSTMTRQLLVLADWLTSFGVTRVVMEATGDYWRPPFYVLEGVIADTWLVNATDVKNLPSRPKTDLLTELVLGSFRDGVRCPGLLVRFAARDQRRGSAAGSGRVGSASGRAA